MRTVLLIRHAKSDQSFFGNDFDRPLNDRGKKDAPVMAQRLMEKQVTIDAFISSPAIRAKSTAEIFAKAYEKPNINFVQDLYHAPPRVFFEVISQLPDNLEHIAIFSHNPGITNFVNLLTENTRLDNMPTCAIFAVRVAVESWKDFEKAKKEFLFFDYPKKQ